MTKTYPCCPECGGEIGLGIAIRPEMEYGSRYLIPVPPLKNEDIEIISVYKCKSCGYSCDHKYDLIWEEAL